MTESEESKPDLKPTQPAPKEAMPDPLVTQPVTEAATATKDKKSGKLAEAAVTIVALPFIPIVALVVYGYLYRSMILLVLVYVILIFLGSLAMLEAAYVEDVYWRHLLIELGAATFLFVAIEIFLVRATGVAVRLLLLFVSIGLLVAARFAHHFPNPDYSEVLLLVLGMVVGVFLLFEVYAKHFLRGLAMSARKQRDDPLGLGEGPFEWEMPTTEEILADLDARRGD